MQQRDKTESIAIEQFALSVTVPILVDAGNSAHLRATGTLFKIEQRAFLITARHIFEGVEPDKLAYPENPKRGALHTFGSINILTPTDEHVDVAAIELLDMRTVQRFEKNWQFLSLENVAAASPTTSDGSCFVSGYPASLTNNYQGWTAGKFVTAYTQRIPGVPAGAVAPVMPDLDLFFDYSREATSITGVTVQTPELPGVSGASIWELAPGVSGVWAPEAIARVVGVQSSFLHSGFIRAKSWWAVARVLEQSDEQLAVAIRARLGQC